MYDNPPQTYGSINELPIEITPEIEAPLVVAAHLSQNIFSRCAKVSLQITKGAALSGSFLLFTSNQAVTLFLTSVELFSLKGALRNIRTEQDMEKVVRLAAAFISIGVISLASASANTMMSVNNYLKSAEEDLEHRRQCRKLRKNSPIVLLTRALTIATTICRELLQAGMSFASYRVINEMLSEAFPNHLRFLSKNILTHTLLPLVATGIGNFTYAYYITHRYNKYASTGIALAAQETLKPGIKGLCKWPDLCFLGISTLSTLLGLIYSFGYILDLRETFNHGISLHNTDKILNTIKSVFYYLGLCAAFFAGAADAIISGWHLADVVPILKSLRCDAKTFFGLFLGIFSSLLGVVAGPVGIYLSLVNTNAAAAWICAGVAAAFDLPAMAAFELGNGLQFTEKLTNKIKKILCNSFPSCNDEHTPFETDEVPAYMETIGDTGNSESVANAIQTPTI